MNKPLRDIDPDSYIEQDCIRCCVTYSSPDSNDVNIHFYDTKFSQRYSTIHVKSSFELFAESDLGSVLIWDTAFLLLAISAYFLDRWIFYKTGFRILQWIHRIKSYVISGELDEIDVTPALRVHTIKGKYNYKCIQSDDLHEHGGTCFITPTYLADGYFKWSLAGKRTWRRDSINARLEHLNPFSWSSQIAIITDDRKFQFSYKIDVDGENSSGFSEGVIEIDEGSGLVQEFHGNYFQRSQGKIVDGRVYFSRI